MDTCILPIEICNMILLHADSRTIARACTTCRVMHDLLENGKPLREYYDMLMRTFIASATRAIYRYTKYNDISMNHDQASAIDSALHKIGKRTQGIKLCAMDLVMVGSNVCTSHKDDSYPLLEIRESPDDPGVTLWKYGEFIGGWYNGHLDDVGSVVVGFRRALRQRFNISKREADKFETKLYEFCVKKGINYYLVQFSRGRQK